MKENVEIYVGEKPDGIKTATVTDYKSGRAWSGEGGTTSEAATKAMRSFLGDRRAREYLDK